MEIISVKDTISPSEVAKFQLKITNQESATQRYSLYSLQSGQGWSVDPSPLKDRIIEIRPGQSYTTSIVVDPLEYMPPGIYTQGLTIESDFGESYVRELKVYLLADKPVNYLPALKVDVDMDPRIDPSQPVLLRLILENRNPLDLSDLKLQVESDIPEFVKEVDVALPPLEKKTVEISVVPNPFQEPKEYTLRFVFIHEGEEVKFVKQKFEIIPLELSFSVEEKSNTVFLNRFVELTVKNPGNVPSLQEVQYPLSFWAGLFLKSEAEVHKEGKQRLATWEVLLAPNESKIIAFSIQFRYLFYLLVLVVGLGLFYLWARSPLSVNKTAVATRGGEEGTLSEIKVTLELKNNSRKLLKDVVVTDTVPAIGNVEKSLELGMLKPQEIKHTTHGTKVIWHIPEIDEHEHRLITYKVKAKLNVLGTLSLPRVVADYKQSKKRMRKAYSNIYRLES